MRLHLMDPVEFKSRFDAVVLDLDGVITRTATLHARAWAVLFDSYLRRQAEIRGTPFLPFDPQEDYLRYVDGKPRYDGVRSFLASRGLTLPEGIADEPPGAETIRGLGNKKDELFHQILQVEKPVVFDDAVIAMRFWHKMGLRLAVASSSKNCIPILQAVDLLSLFEVRVDGNDLEQRQIPGKPSPDMFLEAARQLGVNPARALVIEDAVSGIEAGCRGGFGAVIGVARENEASRLLNAGADGVVRGLDELLPGHAEQVERRKWVLRYSEWKPQDETTREALCTLGNGYFATRGAAEEMRANVHHYPGTYLAGGYNRQTTEIQGQEIENEDFVNWPNWLFLSFRPEGGQWLDPERVHFLDFHQELDMRTAVLTRFMRFRDAQGRETSLTSRRIVSMASAHLAAVEWELIPENWSGRIEICSGLDASVENTGVARYRAFKSRHLDVLALGRFDLFDDSIAPPGSKDALYLVAETKQSHIRMAQAARTRVLCGVDNEALISRRLHKEKLSDDGGSPADFIAEDIMLPVEQGCRVRLEKIVSLHSSRDHAISDPLLAAQGDVSTAPAFPVLLEQNIRLWSYAWRRFDIELRDNSSEQMILRLHIFHLLQTISMNTIDLDVGAPARGLHGEAYQGHIFWDELFIFPFFNFRMPELSRQLLEYRFRRLGAARQRAARAGLHGAMYPWQSGSTGREETPRYYYNPDSRRWVEENTQLQVHVNAAIVFNVWQYYQVSQDKFFLSAYGAEMMLEIARFWASLAVFNPARERYDIKGIVGPDEFHTKYPDTNEIGINNNAYTNIMASWSIQKALHVLKALGKERRAELMDSLGLRQTDLDHFNDVSRRLFVPFFNDGIISQFEGYENLRDLDLDVYRAKYGDIQRLDRLLESEGKTTDRYKAGKQADVLMLFYLFSSEELHAIFDHLGYRFEAKWIPKNIQYYMHLTSHGSTLSRSVHAWVLSRSNRERSWSLFRDALRSDIGDIQGGTTREGIHLGAMAETVDLVQRCYTGLEVRDEVLWFNPHLPDELPAIHERIRFRGHWIAITLTHETLRISVDHSWHEAMKIGFRNRTHTLKQGDVKEFHLRQ